MELGKNSTASGSASTDRDILTVAKGGSLKFAGGSLAMLGNFAAGIILARFLGATHLGLFRLGVVSTDLLSRISDLGLQSSIARFIPIAARERNETRLWGILQITCGIPVLVGIAFAVGVFLLADQISVRFFDEVALGPVLRVMSSAIPFAVLMYSGEVVTRSLGRIDFSVYGMELCFPFSRILLLLSLLLAGFGLIGAAVAHVVALAIAALVLAVLVHKLFPLTQSLHSAEHPTREIWRQSLPAFLTRLLYVFSGRLELFVLGVFGMTAGVGIYSVALQLSQVASILLNSLSSVSAPLISDVYSQGGVERVHPLFRSLTKWSVMATLPILLSVVIFAEPLLSVFGEEFVVGRTGVIILSLAPLVNAFAGVSAGIIAMTGHAKLNTLNSIVYLATTIILDLLLIPRWGVLGAAIAATATLTLVNVLRVLEVFLLFRIWPYNWRFLKPVVAGVAAAAAASAVDTWLPIEESLTRAAAGIAVLVAVYALVLWRLGLSQEDRLILDRVRDRLASYGSRS